MTRRNRHRFQIAVLVILCLLFQQAALAAYLCPLEQAPATTMAMTEHCAEMAMAQEQDNAALCQKHCSPDQVTAADTVKLTVPPMALPPMIMSRIYARTTSHVATQVDVPITRSDPPPRLKFCSLLI